MNNLVLLITVAIAALLVYFLRKRRESQDQKNLNKVQELMAKGKFDELSRLYKRYLLIYVAIVVAAIVLGIFQYLQNGRWIATAIIVALFAYRAFETARVYLKMKKADNVLAYRLTEEQIAAIWASTGTDELLDPLYDFIWGKTLNGVAMDRLNKTERNILIMLTLEMEVNNGGFDQFFFNTGEKFNDELVDAAQTIGARKTAELCMRAVGICKSGLVDDDRMDALGKQCDTPFLQSDEYIGGLVAEYARAHKDELFD